ncbi:MAG: DUF1003 domain-containing protein [Coriobacteriia bacterium]|nr:DUF1003 domain-containing protein [Coriobacteriia bacterium]
MARHDKTWHQRHRESFTTGQRVADAVAKAMGSWSFIIGQTVLVVFWIGLNFLAFVKHWDPYPFILLNLMFSVQAAYAAPVIMMSQNRAAERDRFQATADYDTNVKSEAEIEDLQRTLARIELEKLDRIIALLEDRSA